MPTIKLKTGTTTPANGSLQQGELAYDNTNNALFAGNAAGNPVKLVGTLAQYESNNVTITGGTISNVTLTADTVNLTTLTVGGTAVTGVETSVSGGGAVLPTSNAVKTYIDTNFTNVLKNLYSYTGNATYTKSGSDVKVLRVICVGAGGGGRGYHESGGAGGYGERWLDATSISTVAVTVGGGSAGGYYFGFSGQGTTTSFGSFLSATGGYGANQNKSHCGGHGGIGSGGQINLYGGGGGGHAPGANNQQGGMSGEGGASFFGGGTQGRHGGSGFSAVAAPGGGGSGGAGNHNGSDGYTGICLVYEFK
jgi:hypothetical protein